MADEPTTKASEDDSESKKSHDELVDADEQPFLSHLLELRSRVMKALLLVVIFFIPAFYFNADIFRFIAAPLLAHLPNGGTMIATDVASPFLTPLKLSVLAAFFFAVPFVLHQIWGFIAPGLYLREKKFAVPLLISSILLFYLGTAFAYFLVFPLVFQFFATVNLEFVSWMTDISPYLDFIIKMFLAFGIAFEIPVATVLMVLVGFSTPESLARKRPYVFVGCFLMGMVLTPPDIVSQVLLALPMALLFEVGIHLSKIVKRDQEQT